MHESNGMLRICHETAPYTDICESSMKIIIGKKVEKIKMFNIVDLQFSSSSEKLKTFAVSVDFLEIELYFELL